MRNRHGMPHWALPTELAAFEGWRPGRRTVRDWLADAGLFILAGLAWALASWDQAVSPDPEYVAAVPGWMHAVDPWVGAAACLALWWRRRYPLALAVASVPVLCVSSTGFAAVLVAVFTVAVHRGWLPATLVAAVDIGQGAVFATAYQPTGVSYAGYLLYIVLFFLFPLAWGLAVRFRRQVLLGLRREAAQERTEHHRRLSQARRAERERIAREMHDVLAHRISLLSVHAGALAYRSERALTGDAEPPSPAELGQAVRVIRENAHQALSELGEVLTVLRAGEPAEGAARSGERTDGRDQPQPLLRDIERLVAEAAASGQPVTLELDPGLADAPPRPQEQRTVYRVVQEGLTNARKHAAGAPVAVRVAGGPDTGVAVAVRNPLPAADPPGDIPGTGAGLAGLAERVALDGGTLRHGAVGGDFQLSVTLPWHG